MRAKHLQEELMGLLIPHVGDEEQDIPRGDIEHAMQDPPSAVPSNGDADLLTDSAITTVEWWSFRDDGLIQHEDDRAEAASKPPFEPPLA